MQRPPVILVFAMLNMVFAAIGIIGIVASFAMLSTDFGRSNPVAAMMSNNRAFATWMKVSLSLGLAASGVLLAAAVGLWRMQRWGRALSIGYAIYGIVAGLVGSVMNILFLVRPMIEQAAKLQGPEAAGAIGGDYWRVLRSGLSDRALDFHEPAKGEDCLEPGDHAARLTADAIVECFAP